MTVCERLEEMEAGGGLPWDKILTVAGVAGVWVVVLLLIRGHK